MRAKGNEQFDPSQAWSIAEGFLATHGVSPDGLPISPPLVSFLMVGVWAGCRFALLDRELALGVAAAGNERSGLVFEALRLAFAEECEQPLRRIVTNVLRERGFTNAEAPEGVLEPQPDRLSGSEAVDAAEQMLRQRTDLDGEVSS